MKKDTFQKLIQRASKLHLTSGEKCDDPNCEYCNDKKTRLRKTAGKQGKQRGKSR